VGRTVRVLLLEDSPADARLVVETLRNAEGGHFEIERADRLSDALDQAAEGGVDVILADLGLPDAQGLDVVRRLRERVPSLPLVVLTGSHADESVAFKALQTGAQDYLVKDELAPALLTRALRYAIERKQAEKDMAEKQAQLVRARVELDDLQLFAFSASHDMQEPLHKIQAFVSLLKSEWDGKLPETGRETLSKIESAAARMSRVIEDVRYFSKIDADRRAFEPVDLREAVGAALRELQTKVKKCGAQIEVGPLPTVRADAGQMQRLFGNLLSNALKFCSKEGAPAVKIRARPAEDGWCLVEVEDNGIGFEERFLDRLFKPFQRLHTRNEYEGTGLGLAVCHKIVLRHGGKIAARSMPGRGSVFTITLPLDRRSPP
jgi:two-component system, sensor histidine kinase and response regulator